MTRRIRLLIVLIATIVLAIPLGELSFAAHYPDNYGFDCSRAGCAVAYPWHSFALLKHGGLPETALFLLIWLLTIWIIAIPFWIDPRKPRTSVSTSSESE